jgi:preprotein translocase subunit SecF
VRCPRTWSARAAVQAGFDRVWITSVDTHVTSLIAAAFLYQFGMTAIRGFATTLTIGLLANVFIAVFLSRTSFEVMLRFPAARDRVKLLPQPIAASKKTAFNFMRWSSVAMALSLAVIAAGVVHIATNGLPVGIDFSGGTLVIAEFPAHGVTDEDVRAAVAPLPGDEVVQRYGGVGEGRFLIRLPLEKGGSPDAILDSSVEQVRNALHDAKLPSFDIAGRELVSATIGKDLQRQGMYATLASLIGYSVNDTIVIFDRVRENAVALRREPLAEVINRSVNQTMSRTLITAGTTLLSLLAVYLFGGEALRNFAFTMLVGIVSGTYSTVFTASAIAARLSRRKAA